MNETPVPLVVWAMMMRWAVMDLVCQFQRLRHLPDRVPVHLHHVPPAG